MATDDDDDYDDDDDDDDDDDFLEGFWTKSEPNHVLSWTASGLNLNHCF